MLHFLCVSHDAKLEVMPDHSLCAGVTSNKWTGSSTVGFCLDNLLFVKDAFGAILWIALWARCIRRDLFVLNHICVTSIYAEGT